MSNLNFFNALAVGHHNYLNTGRMFTFGSGVFENTFRDINSKLHIQNNDRLLDLGGGAGQLTAYFVKNCAHVVLADGAVEALKLARLNLAAAGNVAYEQVDIQKLPLPFEDNQFDKVICYSVIHYLADYDEFDRLIQELLRITVKNGKILIGDIPLKEKYDANLNERREHFVKNFILNLKYYGKKFVTNYLYHSRQINTNEVKGLSYTKPLIAEIMNKIPAVDYNFLLQNKKLPAADSREDLLITKK